VDVRAGEHVALLRHHAAEPGARLELPPATYQLVARDEENEAHLRNNPRPPRSYGFACGLSDAEMRAAYYAWKPQWRLGNGPLKIAAGVTLMGREGVALADRRDAGDRLIKVETEGVRFESLRFAMGVDIASGGSATMTGCESTGRTIRVEKGASLAMEDCRVFANKASYRKVFRSAGGGVWSGGKLEAKNCKFESIAGNGIEVKGEQALGQLVDCVMRNNTTGLWSNTNVTAMRCTMENGTGRFGHGVFMEGKAAVELVDCTIRDNAKAGALVYDAGSKLTLRGGRVSGNKVAGVAALDGGTVVVAAAEEGRHQTVSEGHPKKGNWVDQFNAGPAGQIEGLAARTVTQLTE